MNVDADALFADVVWPFLDSASPRVLREANGDACAECGDLDGVWDADDEAAQPSHPNCSCSFTPLDDNDRPSGAPTRGDSAAALAGGRMVGKLMANLSAADRKAIPDSDFAGPHRTFPVHDQDHLDAAVKLVGRISNAAQKATIIAGIKRLAKKHSLTLPDSWSSDSADHSAAIVLGDLSVDFGVPPTTSVVRAISTAAFSNGTVLRRGKVFEAGEHEAQSYGMTPEEMLLAAESFTPVPVRIEHMPSVLDGKLGTLKSISLAANGWDLEGEIELPDWLDTALGTGPVPVSMAWDRDTKTALHIGLVVEPAVTDAAVAAFAKRHDTPQGQMAAQRIHDIAADAGATCSPANFASRHEASFIQQTHDGAVQHGATCASTSTNKGSSAAMYSAPRREGIMGIFDGFFSRLTPEERAQAKADLDAREAQAAAPAGITATLYANGAQIGTSTTPPAAAFSAISDPEKVELTRLRQERIESRADAVIAANKAMPASRETLVALFSRAAAIDNSAAAATFSAGEPSTTALLERTFAELPGHSLTTEQLDPNLHAAGNQLTTPPPANGLQLPTDAELRALLAQSDLGKQALARKR